MHVYVLLSHFWGFPGGAVAKNPPATAETQRYGFEGGRGDWDGEYM